MRALITGGKGFVGQWLAAHLKDSGDEVAVIDVETDVADGAAVRRVMADVAPDAIYHLAAMTHVGESWDDPSRVLRVNVLGHGRDAGRGPTLPVSPRVLVVSSAEVYGVVTPAQLPLDEDTPSRPGQPLRRQQAGRRSGGPPGLAGLRAAGAGGAALQPHRARASHPTSSCRRWPSASSRPRDPAPMLAGRGHAHHPA